MRVPVILNNCAFVLSFHNPFSISFNKPLPPTLLRNAKPAAATTDTNGVSAIHFKAIHLH